jgi:outer membrane scaffolding protein for murein synthesis (MipA/OmpV family)
VGSTKLRGDAAKSPIFDRKREPVTSLTATYAW